MQVQGLKQAINDFQNLTHLTFEDAVLVIQQVGEEIAAAARNDAPVRTGRLQGSIHSENAPDGCVVAADAPYAGFVNGGTRRMAARPFFTNALLDAQDKILAKIHDRLEGKS